MAGKAHGGTFQLSGNAQNRPTGLAYDATGNLMSYLSSTYTYDQENRLSSTAGMSYTYDGNGERVLKFNASTGAAVKRYWSMGGNTLAEGDGSGNLTAEYIYFGGKRVARIDLPANTVHYYLSDHLGSTSIVASAAETVEEESDYYPFGTEVIVSSTGTNKYKFTGKERDAETGLDYFGARYYSNGLGRWVTPDAPFADQHLQNPQSWNLYMYAGNRPTSLIDTDGREVKEIRTTTYYSVSGSTANEAMQNANANGPNGHAGMTTPIIGANYSFSSKTSPSTNGNVTVTDTVTKDTVNLQQTIELPKWDGRDNASPEEQKTWDSAASDLQTHENTHADQNRESADALDKSLPGTKASATGKPGDKKNPPGKAAEQKLNGAVQDKINNTVKDINQKSNQLDEKTHHGTMKEPQ
jgi:RHS repeat-associated protein